MLTGPLAKTLIREDLRNKKLTHSLEAIGLDCSYYITDLSREILQLCGFKALPNELFKWYFNLTEEAIEEITPNDFTEILNKWTEKIYNELIKKCRDLNIES
jgi:Ni,Fe-hydrogenase I large subunit